MEGIDRIQSVSQVRCWVKCPPVPDETLNLSDFPAIFNTSCRPAHMEQLGSPEFNQLEEIVNNPTMYGGGEYEDSHGTRRVLHPPAKDIPSVMTHYDIQGYISTHADDPSRVRLLLRGTVENMRQFSMVCRFLQRNALLTTNWQLKSIDALRSFLHMNPHLSVRSSFHCGIIGYSAPIGYLLDRLNSQESESLMITNLPAHVWPQCTCV